jgi:hypothetical protein
MLPPFADVAGGVRCQFHTNPRRDGSRTEISDTYAYAAVAQGVNWFSPTARAGVYDIDGLPDFEDVTCLAVDPVDSQIVYAGTFASGIYRSTDAGRSWQPYNTGIEDKFITSLALHPLNSDRIYAAAIGGVYRLPVPGLFEVPAR